MHTQEYVTTEEVRRVCNELNISDWTKLTESRISPEEAGVILAQLDLGGMDVPLDNFQQGLEVELEHGTRFKEANVTTNHPVLTGQIVLAHFRESLDYYKRLEVAEIEGDLLKATGAKDAAKREILYKRLINARSLLSQAESNQLA